MRILLINPNSDAEMTAAIQTSAEAFAAGEYEVLAKATPGAPQFIETYRDELLAAPGMMQLVRVNEDDYDAIIIACHCDPNLDAMKEICSIPVVGIGEASMKLATMLGHSFSVVTTHIHSIPGKVANARKMHLHDLMVSVRAPEKGEEDLGDEQLFLELSRRAVEEDLAEVIVLGCAGLTGMDKKIEKELGVPVLDGVICALIIATGLVRYGVSTSKILGYNPEY
ncbi:aspartate/glutamate racemase family protein [Candidatus Zixiibacteriota bacterium]